MFQNPTSIFALRNGNTSSLPQSSHIDGPVLGVSADSDDPAEKIVPLTEDSKGLTNAEELDLHMSDLVGYLKASECFSVVEDEDGNMSFCISSIMKRYYGHFQMCFHPFDDELGAPISFTLNSLSNNPILARTLIGLIKYKVGIPNFINYLKASDLFSEVEGSKGEILFSINDVMRRSYRDHRLSFRQFYDRSESPVSFTLKGLSENPILASALIALAESNIGVRDEDLIKPRSSSLPELRASSKDEFNNQRSASVPIPASARLAGRNRSDSPFLPRFISSLSFSEHDGQDSYCSDASSLSSSSDNDGEEGNCRDVFNMEI